MEFIDEASFRSLHQGQPTALYTLRNKNGLTAQVTNYGGLLVSLYVPDKKGQFSDIVQGYDNLDAYIQGNSPYMGAVCGRCANRIGKGKFSLMGKEYTLAVNNGPNHLHGGLTGFNKVIWEVTGSAEDSIHLSYLSRDGEEGYPGNLNVTLSYTLTGNNELRLDYRATTDKTTVVNLAGHSYFNLAGEGSGDIYHQELMINAKFFTPVDESSLPTGEVWSVKGTPMDFTAFKKLGRDIDAEYEQIRFGAGYDHNWVLDHRTGKMGLAAVARDPQSGRVMEVYTTQPGMQLYTANWIDAEKGKGGKIYRRRWAFCLETQHFADAVNKPHFPSPVLEPGETYQHTCIYRFSVL
jgi:aldose 1-epimerase